ncbi:MAG: PaaI family thioesterase [Pseudomonadota bacterium]|nr:PaaI family thioesterase [Pseudomonadota bacterium]
MINLIDHMPFANTLGIEIEEATPERVVGTLVVDEKICTTGKIMHGGALMAFADTLGAVAAFLNLPEGAKASTTIESKTNFLGPAPRASTVRGECTPLHIGRRTSVWQTRLVRRAEVGDDKLVAIVTQTQMVLS